MNRNITPETMRSQATAISLLRKQQLDLQLQRSVRSSDWIHCLKVYLVPDRKLLFFPIFASGSNYNPRNTQCIPVVIIFAFLNLGKNS